jgi:hypothetical protein
MVVGELNYSGHEEGQMDELSSRLRISALWILHIIAFFAYRTLALGDGATEVSMLSGSDFASYLAAMMAITIFGLILTGRTNRMMNIIAGSVVCATQIIMFVDGIIGYPSASFNVFTGATIVITAAIIWFAVKMPKR